MGSLRTRFWIEAGTAVISGVLAVVTVFWRDWIEISGWEPDHHDGSAEWLVVVVLATVSLGAAALARVEWRQRAVAVP